jgi:Uma2 family endonuclease
MSETSRDIDLNEKLRDYERAGVREYVVVLVGEPRIAWFVRDGDRLRALDADSDGVYRSKAFPGLWLDGAALLQRDVARLAQILRQGLATAEHQAFVDRLRRP